MGQDSIWEIFNYNNGKVMGIEKIKKREIYIYIILDKNGDSKRNCRGEGW